MTHTHQYTIADDEAVRVLLDKLLSTGSHQQRREKLLKALDEASQRYRSSTQTRAQGILPRPADRLRGRPQAVVAQGTRLPFCT